MKLSKRLDIMWQKIREGERIARVFGDRYVFVRIDRRKKKQPVTLRNEHGKELYGDMESLESLNPVYTDKE